jgi:Transcriptional regulator
MVGIGKGGSNMPKVVSGEERQRTKNMMHEQTITLIKKKGLKKVTVEDVCTAVNIGKGSFYSYYKSKEALFYEVIKDNEKSMFAKITAAQNDGGEPKERIHVLFREIYLAPDSIALYVDPADMDWLIRKLPVEYYEREKAKAINHFELFMSALNIDSEKIDINVLSGLVEAITYIATDKDRYNEDAKQTILDILVRSVANYLFQ